MIAGGDITGLLQAWREGDPEAAKRLFPIVYERLRAMARGQLSRPGPPATLSATELVHEAYLKLVDRSRLDLRDRGHFFAVAAKAMRQLLLDHARRRSALKRGAGQAATPFDEMELVIDGEARDVIAVDEALARLEQLDSRMGQVVELRFFGGLEVEEVAEALEVSVRTVKRDWQKARAFLHRELAPGAGS
jgi:RNA polymerase sigma factor (TIGR02999 family)